MTLGICSECLLEKTLNQYGRCDECESKKIVDIDTHMKIFNFLIHLENCGIIEANQRVACSMQIQAFLKDKEYRLELLNKILDQY